MDRGPARVLGPGSAGALAVHRTCPPSPVIHANRKRLRKGGPSERPRAPDLRRRPRVSPQAKRGKPSARARPLGAQAFGSKAFGSLDAAHRHRRTASLRSLAQSIWGDPPSHAGPRSPCPFGRSHLSVGEAAWTGDLLGSWAQDPRGLWSEPPWLIRKRQKGAVKHARSKRKNKGRKKQKKKKNQINKKKKKKKGGKTAR